MCALPLVLHREQFHCPIARKQAFQPNMSNWKHASAWPTQGKLGSPCTTRTKTQIARDKVYSVVGKTMSARQAPPPLGTLSLCTEEAESFCAISLSNFLREKTTSSVALAHKEKFMFWLKDSQLPRKAVRVLSLETGRRVSLRLEMKPIYSGFGRTGNPLQQSKKMSVPSKMQTCPKSPGN